MEEETHRHEAFGQIGFTRTQGYAKFYGSELEQDHYITLKIYNSEIKRELTQDRYYVAERKPLIDLRMTSGAFSEMITNMNMADGVCCTLEYVNGKKMAELPQQESRKEFVHRKFQDRMAEFGNRIKEKQKLAKELINKKNLSRQDLIMEKKFDHIECRSFGEVIQFGVSGYELVSVIVYSNGETIWYMKKELFNNNIKL